MLEVPGYDNEINEIFSTYVARIITYLLSSKNIIYQSLDAYENINYIGQLG
jgi:hypothetical protein